MSHRDIIIIRVARSMRDAVVRAWQWLTGPFRG